MAPLPAVPKVLECALHFDIGSDANVVTRHYIHYSGTAPTDLQATDFAGWMGVQFDTACAAGCNPDVHLHLATVIDLSSATSASGENAADSTGTRAGAKLPASVAAVVGYGFGRRYRGGHARGYWPFGCQPDVNTPQFWTDSAAVEWGGLVQGYFSALLDSGWSGSGTLTHCNVSRYHGFTVVTDPVTGRARNVPTPRSTPLIDTVTTWVGRQRIGTQRRRLGR